MGPSAGNTGGSRRPVKSDTALPARARGQFPNVAAAGVKPTAGGGARAALVGVRETGVTLIPLNFNRLFGRWG